MDLSCIISSGDLELYVLGMLPEEEGYKIAQLAKLFPEVQAELDRIALSLEGLAATATATPSASVKNNVMGRLRELKEEEQAATIATTNDQKTNENGHAAAPVSSIVPRRSSWMMAASLIGFLLSLGALIFFISRSRETQAELASLKQQVDTLQNSMHAQQQQIVAYTETMQMMHDSDYKKIELTSVPGKPQAMAQVFWNMKTKEVYIADVSLPKTPADKQYQLWAIVDGKPVDAGMLSDAKNLAQKMKVFEKADAFAITLEKKGGNSVPTMEQMYVIGKV